MRIFNYLIILAIFSVPSIALASACMEVQNQIYSDIQKYPLTISDKKVDWKNLSWIEAKLGQGKKDVLNGNAVQYTWQCDDESPIAFKVTANNNTVTFVSGVYNLDEGSGIFSKTLNPENTSTQ